MMGLCWFCFKSILEITLHKGLRNYNPKRHEGYVTITDVGIEEWGAMDSGWHVEIDGKRIPNKWDNKVDPNKAFFGEL